MNYDNIPILKALKEYSKEGVATFHVPGHKYGNVFKKINSKVFDFELLKMDLTEVPGIDNLHDPENAIKEAQDLAAQAFGADYSFFLVNGTTAGIYSMILASTNPGDKIIIPRNCHKSVISAVILGKLQPIYINPVLDIKLNIASGISQEIIKTAIKDNPTAKAVVITNPTYYGVCSDIEQIAKIVHHNKMMLLVDEAHGSHFGFHPKLPKTSLQCGADMVAQSTHKTLPSMTQSSMLHVKSDRVDLDKLKLFLQLTQSTSPSHILLASLDTARYIMEQKGEELLDEVIYWCNWLRDAISSNEKLYCLGKADIGRDGIFDIDSTRVTVNLSKSGMSGTQADALLRNRFKIQVEMADLYNIVAICTLGDDIENIKRLANGINKISQECNSSLGTLPKPSMISLSIPKMSLLPWEAVYQPKESVPVEQCVGRICGEMIVPYPPGIPLIMPGETINQEIIDYARECQSRGIKINGTKDSSLESITVIK